MPFLKYMLMHMVFWGEYSWGTYDEKLPWIFFSSAVSLMMDHRSCDSLLEKGCLSLIYRKKVSVLLWIVRYFRLVKLTSSHQNNKWILIASISWTKLSSYHFRLLIEFKSVYVVLMWYNSFHRMFQRKRFLLLDTLALMS